MPRLNRRVLVYMDEKLADWLEGKAQRATPLQTR